MLWRSLAVATAFSVFALLLSSLVFFGRGGISGDLLPRLGLELAYTYVWAFQVPVLAPFFARYPLSERPWRHTLYYFGASLAAAIAPASVIPVFLSVARQVGWHPSSPELAAMVAGNLGRAFAIQWIAGIPAFWIIATIFQTVVARAKVRELQGLLAQAELQNLKSQLHPHFLFNTLHTISVLMREDAEAANRVLLKLSELLRVSLDRSGADRIPLQQELDFLEAYLAIEQTRFQERLRLSIAADGDARAALIPTLLLQPLVENAVRHGIAPRASGGSLSISARRVDGVLELKVEDDGLGLAADYPDRRARGYGIRNTEGRLRALCGPAGHLEVGARTGGGVAVSISLPYRQS
ncbi:MAG TPA: histidine kinase [Bryobacteraceae bacterium]|nr:histidine kinase [Bryobacteraceae bacterium]